MPGTFHAENTGDTAANLNEDWFYWDMLELRFSALLRCDSEICLEVAALAGKGRMVEDPDLVAHKMAYSELFEVTYINPAPRLISVPTSTPETVVRELCRADVAQWDDPDAAAMHVRNAVERLLDELQVPVTQAGKRPSRLGLHDRINLLRATRTVEAESLLATKWIGNAGAHGQEITRNDVFDMLDILEQVLDQIYGNRAEIQVLVKDVNARKGPARMSKDLL